MSLNILRAPSPRERLVTVLGYIGLLWMIAGVVPLLPLLALPFYPDEQHLGWAYLATSLLLILPGASLYRAGLNKPRQLYESDAPVIVLLAWLGATLATAPCLMWTVDLSFSQALFESTSGWTTTGLSVIHVEAAPRSVLILRSSLELAGGAGLAILMVSFLSVNMANGLTAAEGRADRLVPHVVASTKLVLSLYVGYTLFGVLALWLAGMSLFDAINHSFAAVSTGGFSTYSDSIGHWDSAAIEAVTIVLMILGSTNFLLAWNLLRRRYDEVWRHPETRLSLALIITCSILLLVFVTSGAELSWSKALRVALFEVVTSLTTTGFSTVGYTQWPSLGWLVLIMLMLIGGHSGSTAGGLKQLRVYLLARLIWTQVSAALAPRHAIIKTKVWSEGGWHFISDAHMRSISAFSALYMLVLALGVGVMCAYGFPLKDSIFEMASTQGTVGLSVGVTSSSTPAGVLWVQILGMLLGRLEFFVVLVASIKLFEGLRHLPSLRHPPTSDHAPPTS